MEILFVVSFLNSSLFLLRRYYAELSLDRSPYGIESHYIAAYLWKTYISAKASVETNETLIFQLRDSLKVSH